MKPSEVILKKVNELLAESKLSSKDRSKLYALCGYMADADDGETSYEEFLLMYLSKDRDWEKDHAAIFGTGKTVKRNGETPFSTSRIRKASIEKNK